MASTSSRLVENASEEQETTEIDDVEELQSEVSAMATKIMEYRNTLPDLLKSGFASLLEAHRPVINLPASVSDPGLSDTVAVKGGVLNSLEVESPDDTAEKIRLLKQKMSSNASALPIVMKRLNDCIARIDKLDACNFIIDPVFKRKRID